MYTVCTDRPSAAIDAAHLPSRSPARVGPVRRLHDGLARRIDMAIYRYSVQGPGGEIESVTRPMRASRATVRARADQVPITEIMTSHVVCATAELPLADLLEVMVRDRLGCVPIIDEDERPIGMVTKLDIVHHLA